MVLALQLVQYVRWHRPDANPGSILRPGAGSRHLFLSVKRWGWGRPVTPRLLANAHLGLQPPGVSFTLCPFQSEVQEQTGLEPGQNQVRAKLPGLNRIIVRRFRLASWLARSRGDHNAPSRNRIQICPQFTHPPSPRSGWTHCCSGRNQPRKSAKGAKRETRKPRTEREPVFPAWLKA